MDNLIPKRRTDPNIRNINGISMNHYIQIWRDSFRHRKWTKVQIPVFLFEDLLPDPG